MVSRRSFANLRRVSTPRGRRWYDPSIGQYVKVEWEKPTLADLSKRVQEILDCAGWESTPLNQDRYKPRRYKRGRNKSECLMSSEDPGLRIPNSEKFKDAIILASEFFKNSKDALQKVESSAASAKYEKIKYIVSFACFKFSTDGLKASKHALKIMASSPISGAWNSSKVDVLDLITCIKIMVGCLEIMASTTAKLNPKNGMARSFIEELSKILKILNKDVVTRIVENRFVIDDAMEDSDGNTQQKTIEPYAWEKSREVKFFSWS